MIKEQYKRNSGDVQAGELAHHHEGIQSGWLERSPGRPGYCDEMGRINCERYLNESLLLNCAVQNPRKCRNY